jgi:hypothetical protein
LKSLNLPILKSEIFNLHGVTYGTENDGFDYVEFTADGTRILKIVGFFGPFPR